MAASSDVSNGVKTSADVEKTPQGTVKRWVAELDLAEQADKDWHEQCEKVWKLYRSKDQKSNSYNIFWANTETMAPAIYNSAPVPDVRRRFGDADPIGKIASTALERGIAFQLDAYDFDDEVEKVVLDSLISGRGVARVKYVPSFKPLPSTDALAGGMDPQDAAGDDPTPDDGPATDADLTWLNGPANEEGQREVAEPDLDPQEEVIGETALAEHVAWDAFRHGPGKAWNQVPWIAFRHEMPYDQLVEQFGKDAADDVPLSEVGDTTKIHDKDVRALLKTALVWEIWDKAQQRVLFICEGYKHGPLKETPDPLKLAGFYPTPRPIFAIKDTTSLVAAIPYKKYEQQALELNRVTQRINRIIDACKVRGAYSAHLSEVSKIIEATDNAMIPIENASEIANMGGLDKAIWMMPIGELLQVLDGLIKARQAIIQTIYDITGIADIMRGSANPHETLGAQQIKTQWGSVRLQRQQRECQRYIRDLIRMKADIMSQHFQVETFETMTGIQLPTQKQKDDLQQQVAMAQANTPTPIPPVPAQGIAASGQPPDQVPLPAPPPRPTAPMPQIPGMPPPGPTPGPAAGPPGAGPSGAPPSPPPPPALLPQAFNDAGKILALPTWQDVLDLLRSPTMRQYRIDVETDSTITETITRDVLGMQQAMQAVVQVFTEFAPAVQAGYISIDVVKALALAIVRESQMGQNVEDAIDQMQQPPPPPPKPPDPSVQVAAIKAQSDAQLAQVNGNIEQQIKAAETQSKIQLDAAKSQAAQQLAATQADSQMKIAAAREETTRQVAAATELGKQQREAAVQQAQATANANSDLLDAAVKIIVAQMAATQSANPEVGSADAIVQKAFGSGQAKDVHSQLLGMIAQKLTNAGAPAPQPSEPEPAPTGMGDVENP